MEYLIHIIILFSIYAILAVSLNLIVGYTGLLSLSHAAYYGIGAYSVAILQVNHEWNFFVALTGGVMVSAFCSLLVGLVLSKFTGDYYALVSVGFNVIVYTVLLSWQSLTRGSFGIPGISRPHLFGIDFNTNSDYMILCLIILVGVFTVSMLIVRSSFGRVLKAIREDARVIQVFGYRVFDFKLLIYVMSSVCAAIAGGLFASYITFIDPASFLVSESILVLSMIILGGLANIYASLLGACCLVVLPEILRFVGLPTEVAAQMRSVIYGLLLVVLMLYKPQGILGEYKF